MNKQKKNVLKAFGVAVLLQQAAACTFSDVDASTVGCVFSGGPIDGSDYQSYVKPGGGREMVGWLEDIVEYPVGVRQFRMSPTQGEGDTPTPETVNVKVRGVDQSYPAILSFTISSVEDENGKPAGCELIEQHLRPLHATDFNDGRDSDWVREFLNERLKPQFVDEAIKVLQNGDPTALANNTGDARSIASKEISDKLTEKFSATLGGDFFCSPSYSFGDPAENCGNIEVTLLAPGMSAEDAALIAAPQRAKTEADNLIAQEKEKARQSSEIADQLEVQAESAERQSAAKAKISEEAGKVTKVDVANQYAWCAYLASLDQDCAEVKAAENNDYPDIVLGDSDSSVAIPVPEATTTTVAEG